MLVTLKQRDKRGSRGGAGGQRIRGRRVESVILDPVPGKERRDLERGEN